MTNELELFGVVLAYMGQLRRALRPDDSTTITAFISETKAKELTKEIVSRFTLVSKEKTTVKSDIKRIT